MVQLCWRFLQSTRCSRSGKTSRSVCLMKDAAEYNREMKVSGLRYKEVWRTCPQTGYRYKTVKTLSRGER